MSRLRRSWLAALAGAVGAASMLAAAPSVATGSGPSELMAQLIVLTNQDRVAAGCQPLAPQSQLAEAAQAHAEEMSQRIYFSHTSLDGRTFDQRIRAAGYQGREFGENIASGFPSAEEVQPAWMAKPAHRNNIVDCLFREIGVGYVENGQVWVVDFGG